MKRRRLCLSALMMVFVLCASACDEKLETKDIPASGFWTHYRSAGGKDTFACFPITCFIPQGTGNYQLDHGTIMVGFDSFHELDADSPACPCRYWFSYVFRGDVYFVVKGFKTIVTATLMFDEGPGAYREGDSVSNAGESIGALFQANPQAGIAEGTVSKKVNGFPAVGAPVVAPFPTSTEIKEKSPLGIKKSGKSFEVDVTQAVKEQLKISNSNFGFVFVGRDESLPSEVNHADATAYKNFRLRIIYNPKEQ